MIEIAADDFINPIVDDASSNQKHGIKVAFIAGFIECLNVCSQFADLPEDDAVIVLENLHVEARMLAIKFTQPLN